MALELVDQVLYVYVNKILKGSYRQPTIIMFISHSCFLLFLGQFYLISHQHHCFSTSSSPQEPDPLSILSLSICGHHSGSKEDIEVHPLALTMTSWDRMATCITLAT